VSANLGRFHIGTTKGVTAADVTYSRTNTSFTLTFAPGSFGPGDALEFGTSVFDSEVGFTTIDVSGLFGRRRTGGAPLAGSGDVASFLLDEARVAVVPGADFGSDRHIRLSYATSAELIAEGLRRMREAVAKLA
jgi:hypothetical protein